MSISVSLNEAQIIDAIKRMPAIDRARLISKITLPKNVEITDENGFIESERVKLSSAIATSRKQIAAGKFTIVKNKRELTRFLNSL
jgi:hypothetical protein